MPAIAAAGSPHLRPGQRVRVGEIELCYERHGIGGEPLLLVMGIGAQLVGWPTEMVEQFVELGFEVVLFDHRDVGYSSHFQGAAIPNPRDMILKGLMGLPVSVPYTLADMADDAHGLMQAIGHRRYHVFGVSLGGMVSQMLAIRYPSAVKSLTSVMSTTGERRHSIGDSRAIGALLRPPPRTREEAGQTLVEFFRVVGSPDFAHDEAGIRERGEVGFSRAQNPAGFARHLGALVATGNRKRALRLLDLPTLVIHGEADPLIPHRAGVSTARNIPGAEFMSIPGMGHDLPPALQLRLTRATHDLAQRAVA